MGAVALLSRTLHILKKSWLTQCILNFTQPLLYMTAMGLGIGTYITEMGGVSYFRFVGTGIVASTPMWVATFSCTYDVFVKMQYQKLYQAILTAPTSISDIVWGEVYGAVIKSCLYAFAVVIAITLLGQVQTWMAIWFFIPIALLALVFSLISLIYTALNPLIDYFNYYITLFVSPAYLFSGVFFPIDSFPVWAQAVAWVNPMYHGVALCRGILLGSLPELWWAHTLVLLGMSAILAPWPAKLFYRRIIQ
ncbi:MAG: ABC transporter permease [Negativicutes bacterium]|nr:ABC transporter permease [Negativicutes bacterium]